MPQIWRESNTAQAHCIKWLSLMSFMLKEHQSFFFYCTQKTYMQFYKHTHTLSHRVLVDSRSRAHCAYLCYFSHDLAHCPRFQPLLHTARPREGTVPPNRQNALCLFPSIISCILLAPHILIPGMLVKTLDPFCFKVMNSSWMVPETLQRFIMLLCVFCLDDSATHTFTKILFSVSAHVSFQH